MIAFIPIGLGQIVDPLLVSHLYLDPEIHDVLIHPMPEYIAKKSESSENRAVVIARNRERILRIAEVIDDGAEYMLMIDSTYEYEIGIARCMKKFLDDHLDHSAVYYRDNISFSQILRLRKHADISLVMMRKTALKNISFNMKIVQGCECKVLVKELTASGCKIGVTSADNFRTNIMKVRSE